MCCCQVQSPAQAPIRPHWWQVAAVWPPHVTCLSRAADTLCLARTLSSVQPQSFTCCSSAIANCRLNSTTSLLSIVRLAISRAITSIMNMSHPINEISLEVKLLHVQITLARSLTFQFLKQSWSLEQYYWYSNDINCCMLFNPRLGNIFLPWGGLNLIMGWHISVYLIRLSLIKISNGR